MTQDLPDLLFVPEFGEACPLTGEPLRYVLADLLLLGPEALAIEVELGVGARSGRWHVHLADLFEIVQEEGWHVDQIMRVGVGERELAAGVVTTRHDVVPWNEYRSAMARQRATMTAPPPAPAAVRRLRRLDETWEVASAPFTWITDTTPPRVAYLVVVVDPAGRIRRGDLHTDGEPDAAVLAAAVRGATTPHADGLYRAGRPQAVRVAEPHAEALARALVPTGIRVDAAETPAAEAALASASADLGPPIRGPLLDGASDAEVRAFFAAAKRFYAARPWERLRGDRYVGVRLGGNGATDGPWLYASVMGQMEEEPGLTLFDSWLRLCRFLHNEPTFFDRFEGASELRQLEAAGALEGVTLFPLEATPPADGLRLLALGIKPTHRGAYALPTRYTVDGGGRPSFPLDVYTALMEALVAAVKARRARTITSIRQSFETLELRYPARGDEALTEVQGYRLVIEGAEPSAPGAFGLGGFEGEGFEGEGFEGEGFEGEGFEGEGFEGEGPDLERFRRESPLPPGERLVVEAAGDTLLGRLHGPLREALDWVIGFKAGEYALWQYRTGPGTPSPCVADLVGLPALAVQGVDAVFPMRVEPLAGPGPETPTFRREEAQ